MKSSRKLWAWLGVIFLLSFAVLGWIGREIYLTAPPIPTQVVQTDGQVVFTGPQVQRGQEAWLSAGGQQLGSVWGHGSYVAPDWSADWLHREALALQDALAQKEFKTTYVLLSNADYERLAKPPRSIVEALAMAGGEDIEFDPPRMRDFARAADLD